MGAGAGSSGGSSEGASDGSGVSTVAILAQTVSVHGQTRVLETVRTRPCAS